MNSNVHPLVVALVLAITGIGIATWMWGSGAAANIGGPSELKLDPSGHAYVQIQDKLVEHDANGQYLKTHRLGDMGVDLFLGGFDFFANGDILLRRGSDSRSTADNFRAFQRKTNERSIEPESPDSGLFRCELDTKVCTRFGQTGIDFKAAHGIFIDRKTDEVYISDTNHHELRIVDPRTESFGDELARKNVTPELATAARQTWPSHFIRVGDGWWVNNMRTGMNQGGIYLFDDNWRLIRKLILPDGADPIALLAFGDEVWISDWYNDKVRRFSTAGKPLADLDSTGLDDILAHARSERWKYESTSYSGIALILFVLGGLAVRGFAVGMSKDSVKSTRNDRSSRIQPPESVLYLEPDSKMLRRMSLAVRAVVLMLFVLAGLIGYLILFYLKPEVGFQFILPGIGMLSIVVLISWINRSNVGTAIRVEDNLVTLRDYSGRESSCPIHELRYDDTAIATQDTMVFLGRPPASIYKRKELQEKLFPRLAEAQKVPALQMQKILIQQRHPQGVTAILALVGILIYAVWVFMK
jgi:hypothetical protein